MKKIMFAAAAATAALCSAPSFAQSGGTQLIGQVAPVCGIQDAFLSYTFPSVTAGAQVNDPVVLRCNDADGATVQLTSSEGGLESDDFEDLEIEYRATLSSVAINGGSVVLDLPTGVDGDNDASANGTANGGVPLAGGVAGNLNVLLKESAVFAGGYSDTLTAQMTAR